MDALTTNVSRYVREKGINVANMSKQTGISYYALYDSLLNEKRQRELRGRELVAICEFLGVNPMDFMEEKEAG